jgi:hypothetical protein
MNESDPFSTTTRPYQALLQRLVEETGSLPTQKFYSAFTALFVIELSQVFFGPILTSLMKILQKTLLIPFSSYVSRYIPKWNVSFHGKGSRRKTTTLSVEDEEPIIPVVKTEQEDRKSKRGDKRDVEKVQKFGYSKYRFVSKEFLQRNHLLKEEEATNIKLQEQDEEKDQRSLSNIKDNLNKKKGSKKVN